MITALVFSCIFIVVYTVNHALHGDVLYQGQGLMRTVYFSVLISHIVLCTVALPMILITFFFSLTGRFPQHKKIARFTLPVWLYVSITGVAVFAMSFFGIEGYFTAQTETFVAKVGKQEISQKRNAVAAALSAIMPAIAVRFDSGACVTVIIKALP